MSKIIALLIVTFSLIKFFSPSIALLSGIFIAFIFGNPYQKISQKITCNLLALSVVGLGAGINLQTIAQVGANYFYLTIISIFLTMFFGFILGKKLAIAKDRLILISVGTAICGGSAIAAISPVIKAKNHDTSIALGVVFLLNSIALITFPSIGNLLHLSQEQFGLWSALAIHDTSSVVGATSQYGEKALEVGTIVKLARSLWIIPLAVVFSIISRNNNLNDLEDKKKTRKFPLFILGFLLMAGLRSSFPQIEDLANNISYAAKQLLIIAIFFLGTSLTKDVFNQITIRPFLFGILLWIIAASFSLIQVMIIL